MTSPCRYVGMTRYDGVRQRLTGSGGSKLGNGGQCRGTTGYSGGGGTAPSRVDAARSEKSDGRPAILSFQLWRQWAWGSMLRPVVSRHGM